MFVETKMEHETAETDYEEEADDKLLAIDLDVQTALINHTLAILHLTNDLTCQIVSISKPVYL